MRCCFNMTQFFLFRAKYDRGETTDKLPSSYMMALSFCKAMHRGGFSYRRYRRSPRAPLRGGRQKMRPAKKKKKKKKNCVFFLLDRVVFAPPSISPTNILT